MAAGFERWHGRAPASASRFQGWPFRFCEPYILQPACISQSNNQQLQSMSGNSMFVLVVYIRNSNWHHWIDNILMNILH